MLTTSVWFSVVLGCSLASLISPQYVNSQWPFGYVQKPGPNPPNPSVPGGPGAQGTYVVGGPSAPGSPATPATPVRPVNPEVPVRPDDKPGVPEVPGVPGVPVVPGSYPVGLGSYPVGPSGTYPPGTIVKRIYVRKGDQLIVKTYNCTVCRLCCVGQGMSVEQVSGRNGPSDGGQGGRYVTYPNTPGVVPPSPQIPGVIPSYPPPGPSQPPVYPPNPQYPSPPGGQQPPPPTVPGYPQPPVVSQYVTPPPPQPCTPQTTTTTITTSTTTTTTQPPPCQYTPLPTTSTTPRPDDAYVVSSGYVTPPINAYPVIPDTPATTTPWTRAPEVPVNGDCCFITFPSSVQATVSCGGSVGSKCCHSSQQSCSTASQSTIQVNLLLSRVFQLPSRISCSEAVRLGIVDYSQIQGVCSSTSPVNPPAVYPLIPSTPSPSLEISIPTNGPSTSTVFPPEGSYATVTPATSSAPSVIAGFATIVLAAIMCL